MKRHLGLTLLTTAMMVAVLAAQDEPPRPKKSDAPAKAEPKKKADDLPEIKGLEKKEPGKGEAPAGDNDPERLKKIVERINKNMDSSEERLNKKDPGDDTRKIQDEIIKDLDELIKQQNQGGGGGGGGGGGMADASKGGAGGSSGTRTVRKSVKSGSKGGKGSQANNKDNDGGDSKKGKPSTANNEKKEAEDKLAKEKEQLAKKGGGKEGKEGDGMGGKPNPKDKKDNNTIADLFKDVWGHLPLNKRQEMDSYSKERFLAKYDEILRQYYRTISEQGRRKDGE